MGAQLERIAAAVEKTPSAPSPDAGCQAGQDKRHSDLCAQWKAADAAEAGARWGWWQLIIGTIGLILGGITMGAAIAAAVFAKRAAIATEETVSIAKDATDDANKALEIAERNAAAAAEQAAIAGQAYVIQNRAWLKLTIDQIGPVHRRHGVFYIRVSVLIENTGRSPATSVAYRAMAFGLFNNSDEKSTIFVNSLRDMQGSKMGDRGLMPGETAYEASDWCIYPRDIPAVETDDGEGYYFQIWAGCIYRTLGEHGYVMKQIAVVNHSRKGFPNDEIDFDETAVGHRLMASVVQ